MTMMIDEECQTQAGSSARPQPDRPEQTPPGMDSQPKARMKPIPTPLTSTTTIKMNEEECQTQAGCSARTVYLQINSAFRTHTFDFERPNRSCQHIYIDFHTCSRKTGSGWFIYKSTLRFEHIYSILTDPTSTVNISTSISTHALRRLGQDGLSTNQR